MSIYRTNAHCENCVILCEEIEGLKNPEDEVDCFEFQFLHATTCPHCDRLIEFLDGDTKWVQFCTEKRKIVKRWFHMNEKVLFESCPSFNHFHKKCFICNGTWVEATKENSE